VHDNERGIRDLFDKWWEATRANDVDTLLGLMADDGQVSDCGQRALRQGRVRKNGARSPTMTVDGGTEIDEIEVIDGWTWMRTRINVTMTPPTGEPNQRSGCTLTILRK
jgi:ketosteroid isomerase-like protein